MTPERSLICYAIAVASGVLGALGAQLLTAIETGDVVRALGREPVDLAAYWLVTLPVCYLVAGVLGYLGPVRSWRWIVTMMATQSLYTILVVGSGLSLWPLALVMTLVLCLPGFVTGAIGSMIRRRREATAHS